MPFNIPEEQFNDQYEYGVVSIVGPTMPQKADSLAVRFSGAFNSQESAQQYAIESTQREKTQNVTAFNRYVITTKKFVVLPPTQDDNKILEDTFKKLYLDRKRQDSEFDKYKQEKSKVKDTVEKPAIQDAKLNTNKKKEKGRFNKSKNTVRYPADINTVNGQVYTVLSYVKGPLIEDTQHYVVAFTGAFDSKDSAEKACEQMRNFDNNWERYIVNMYEFLSIPPPEKNKILKNVWDNDTLNQIMNGREESSRNARMVQNEFEREKELDNIEEVD